MPKTRKRKTLADKKARKEPKPKVSKYAKKQQPIIETKEQRRER